MKLLFTLLLLPTLAFAAEGDGRYQFVNTSGRDFVLDTRTGKIWERKVFSRESGKTIFAPAYFVQDEGADTWVFSHKPDGPYDFTLIPPKSSPKTE